MYEVKQVAESDPLKSPTILANSLKASNYCGTRIVSSLQVAALNIHYNIYMLTNLKNPKEFQKKSSVHIQ